MERAAPETSAFGEAHPGPAGSQVSGTQVELVLNNHHVVGELQHGPAPRRLVDILNGLNGSFVVLHNGELNDPCCPDGEPRRFQVIHVHRDAILFGMPRVSPLRQASPFEVVTKASVAATIVLPGFEIRGNMYLPADADPSAAPLLASRHFIPLTDATVVAVPDRGRTWREPIVVVNLARALVYAPKDPQAA